MQIACFSNEASLFVSEKTATGLDTHLRAVLMMRLAISPGWTKIFHAFDLSIYPGVPQSTAKVLLYLIQKMNRKGS